MNLIQLDRIAVQVISDKHLAIREQRLEHELDCALTNIYNDDREYFPLWVEELEERHALYRAECFRRNLPGYVPEPFHFPTTEFNPNTLADLDIPF